jgi:antitoxin PrlF
MGRSVPDLFGWSKGIRDMGAATRIGKRPRLAEGYGDPYAPAMILSRISSKAQTTIPRAVRAALGLKQGDQIAYRIEDGHVVLTRAASADPFDEPFAGFRE